MSLLNGIGSKIIYNLGEKPTKNTTSNNNKPFNNANTNFNFY